jgi:hypothetical protein
MVVSPPAVVAAVVVATMNCSCDDGGGRRGSCGSGCDGDDELLLRVFPWWQMTSRRPVQNCSKTLLATATAKTPLLKGRSAPPIAPAQWARLAQLPSKSDFEDSRR